MSEQCDLFAPAKAVEAKPRVAVWVDEITEYPVSAIQPEARRWGLRWSHLWTEPGNEAALHTIAGKIGMARKWFQNKPGFPHYDLVPKRRALAITAGAVPRDLKDWVREKNSR